MLAEDLTLQTSPSSVSFLPALVCSVDTKLLVGYILEMLGVCERPALPNLQMCTVSGSLQEQRYTSLLHKGLMLSYHLALLWCLTKNMN